MSRLFKTGDTYNKTFSVCSSTGAAANADTNPTATIFVNGAADGAVVTVTNPATGIYKAAATLPGAIGDLIDLVIAATVGGVATKAVVDSFRLVAFNSGDTVRLGLTALPPANANAAGGLPVSIAGALDLDEMNADIEAIQAALPAFPLATVTGTPTTQIVTVTGLALTGANDYKDAYALWLTGANAFSAAHPVAASSYATGTTTLTFAGLPHAPTAGDTLYLVGSIKSS